MATKSAVKRLQQSKKRRDRNKSIKSEIRSCRRKVMEAVEAKNKDAAASGFRKVVSLYDKAVKKGVVKANTAARGKSRLAMKVNHIA